MGRKVQCINIYCFALSGIHDAPRKCNKGKVRASKKGYDKKFSTNINMEVKSTLKTNNIQYKHEPEKQN